MILLLIYALGAIITAAVTFIITTRNTKCIIVEDILWTMGLSILWPLFWIFLIILFGTEWLIVSITLIDDWISRTFKKITTIEVYCKKEK